MTRHAFGWLKIFLLLSLVLGGSSLHAQNGVAIGKTTAEASAVLDVHSTGGNKGILIPRTTDHNLISAPANGLLVFNTTTGQFCFYNGGWFVLNEMSRPTSTNTVSHSGNVSINGTLSATTVSSGSVVTTGTISTPALSATIVSADNYALNTAGNGPMPQGGIIMWSGTTPPTGWALCDGGGGRPDLRGRFIVGYDGASSATPANATNQEINYGQVRNTGGLSAVTLTDAQLPSHTHSAGTLNTLTAGAHTHSYTAPITYGAHAAGSGGYDRPNLPDNLTTSSSGGHTHAIDGSTGSKEGMSNQPHENRPPYYVLAFIIKL